MERTEISREIDYFLEYYKTLHPVAFLSYEREAYYSLGGDDFRVTFDDNILCRQEELTLALLPAVVCVVIMMVNGNVGAGVAVAGAFSLRRRFQ